MDVLILADFCGAMDGTSNGRFAYLADMLVSAGNSVEIVTGNFFHEQKRHYDKEPVADGYRITMLPERAYPKNISLRRFFSHYCWGKTVKTYLRDRKKPDVIYAAVPPLTAAYCAARYCEKNGVKFVVDVQDLWPEAFTMVLPFPKLTGVLLAPLRRMADRLYGIADEVCAVSDTYTERALSVSRKCKNGHSVFLGTSLKSFDANVARHAPQDKPTGEIRLGYCGTLGASYDLNCVFESLSLLQKRGVKPPKFIVMGDGPRRDEFERRAAEKELDVRFTGRLPYAEMCGWLSVCDMVVNPITHGAAQSIINKHADYAASGKAVLSTQECEEYRRLVDAYRMGFNCKNGDAEDLADHLQRLLSDEELRNEMGRNARRCAEEKFDRENSYRELYEAVTGNVPATMTERGLAEKQ